MAKRFKCTAKKLLFGNDTSPCWYCQQKTQYAMDESDGSEIWCCFDCMYKIGKIKKFSPSRLKATLNARKSKKKSVLCVKNKEDDHHSINLGGLE